MTLTNTDTTSAVAAAAAEAVTVTDAVRAPVSTVEVLDIIDTLLDAKATSVLAEVETNSCRTQHDRQRANLRVNAAGKKLREVCKIAGDSFLALLRERDAQAARALTAERKLAEVAKSMEHIERLHNELEAMIKGLPAQVFKTLAEERTK